MVEKKWSQSCPKEIIKLVLIIQQLEHEKCTVWETEKLRVPVINSRDSSVLLPLNTENRGVTVVYHSEHERLQNSDNRFRFPTLLLFSVLKKITLIT